MGEGFKKTFKLHLQLVCKFKIKKLKYMYIRNIIKKQRLRNCQRLEKSKTGQLNVLYLDCGAGFMAHTYVKHQIISFKYV